MNKIGTLDIIKAYLGTKELSANNAYIGEIPLIEGSGPVPVPVPNDEIWYTSTDGNIVEPNDTTDLPTIVSNTYSDGKGIIKFATDVTSIVNACFMKCSGLTSVIIPNSVTIIESRAFLGCTGLTSITIGNSVTSIVERAFQGCSSLSYINIPNSVTSIGEDAFNNCISLVSIIVPNSVTSIGARAFRNCSGLTSIIVESGNTVYDSRNNCNAIIETATNTLVAGCQSTIIHNSVTSIGGGAFSGCSSLTSVTIPNSVTSIGVGAFVSCSGLTSVTIPNSVTSIGEWAFGQISAKILFSKLYSTYTYNIFQKPTSSTNNTYNVEFNISEIPTDYNISSILPQTGNKGTITYNIYTDYEPCKVQALALANEKTIVNVYHIDGTSWT